jgi:hypothetical protein
VTTGSGFNRGGGGAHQPRGGGIDLGGFGRQPRQLARFGAGQEARLDDVVVGHPAPLALDVIATFFRKPRAPACFGIAPVQPAGRARQRFDAGIGGQIGIKRAGQRQRLDDRRIVAARHEGHQVAHPQRVFDQRIEFHAARAPPAVSSTRPARPASIR